MTREQLMAIIQEYADATAHAHWQDDQGHDGEEIGRAHVHLEKTRLDVGIAIAQLFPEPADTGPIIP